jgi:hypothetical protein
VISYVGFIVWEYFICGHPHCVVLIFGLHPMAFIRCEFFNVSEFICSFRVFFVCDGGDKIVLQVLHSFRGFWKFWCVDLGIGFW